MYKRNEILLIVQIGWNLLHTTMDRILMILLLIIIYWVEFHVGKIHLLNHSTNGTKVIRTTTTGQIQQGQIKLIEFIYGLPASTTVSESFLFCHAIPNATKNMSIGTTKENQIL
jgi:hypothetical protein